MVGSVASLVRLLPRATSTKAVIPGSRNMSNTTQSKVRLVLFDVFDTLCTPRLPIHEQYYEEAIRAGISKSTITPESVRAGFKPAFRSMDTEYPLYGKQGDPPISPEQWWTELILRCLRQSGVKDAELNRYGGIVSVALLERFESDHGYIEFPETIETLKELRRLGIKTSIVSNADPRILKTLDALRILPLISYPPILSWDMEASKPAPVIFKRACEVCEEASGAGVIMIGDELKADYRGAISAGLEARLIRRVGNWSDGASRESDEDLTDVTVISNLKDVVGEVRRRNGTP